MGKPLEPIPVYEPLRDIPVLLHIQDKQKQLVPFVPNKMQADYLPRKTRRNIILKARQMGFSVGELADNMLRTIFVPGTNYAIVSHDETLARNLLVDFVRPWLKQLESYGLCPTIGRSNENEITFPNIKSSIRILSSKGDSPGRGKTYHILHATEAAFWKDGGGIMAGLLASVPPTGIVTVESTPNGAQGWFFKEYTAATRGASKNVDSNASDFTPFFFPWWFDTTYTAPIADKTEFIRSMTGDEKRLMAKHGLTLEQINWRRIEIRRSERGEGLFLQEYPEDDISCFLTSGSSVFRGPFMERLIKESRNPIETDPDIGLKTWKEPSIGHRYVIGVDTAEGIGRPGHDADYSAAVVMDAKTMEHVATMRSNTIPPEQFAVHLHRLGMQYNEAYLAVERRSSGYSVNRILRDDLGYPNLHIEIDPDKPWKEIDAYNVGHMTSGKSKPNMIAMFGEALRTGDFLTYDEDLLREIQTYTYEENAAGRVTAGAPGDAHDDIIMAAMIAVYVREYAPIPRALRSAPTSYMVA